MHVSIKYLPVFLLVTVLFAGCLNEKKADQYGYHTMRGIIGEMADVPYWITMFKAQKNRWPVNAQEMFTFVNKRSNGKIRLPCDNLEFKEKDDGKLEVKCLSLSNGVTNQTVYVLRGSQAERQP